MTVNISKSYIWTADRNVNMKAILGFELMTSAIRMQCSSNWAKNVWFSYIHSHFFITLQIGIAPVPVLNFFRRYFHYCSSSVYYREDRFHIHVFIRSSHRSFLQYSQSFIHHFTGLFGTNIVISSQLACYRRGHEFKSRKGLNFFQALFHCCLSSVHYYEGRFHILKQIWDQRML